MKNHLLNLTLFPLLLLGQLAQAALTPGDIAFVHYNSVNPDNFAFVILTSLPAQEQIHFTDNGWLNPNATGFRTGEGIITWTAPANDLTAGTVVTLSISTASIGTITTSGTLNFSEQGDQLIAYQNNDTILAALNNSGNQIWQSEATNSQTSALPLGLTLGLNAIALQQIQNARYQGPITGDRSGLLNCLNDPKYWIGHSSQTQTFSDNFTLGPALSFTSTNQHLLEATTSITLTIKLSEPITQTLNIPFTLGGTATLNQDYQLSNNSLSIPSGKTETNLPIKLLEDQELETNETILINLEKPSNALPGIITTHTILIQDNDSELIINEVDYDQPTPPQEDSAEFIELKNISTSALNLENYTLEFFTDATDQIYRSYQLPNLSLAAGDYYVICGNSQTVPNCDFQISPNKELIENALISPDAIAIKRGSQFIDALTYTGNTNPFSLYVETTATTVKDSAQEILVGLSRFPDGTDTNDNQRDFALRCITPGGPNLITDSQHCFTLSIHPPAPVTENSQTSTNLDFTVTLSHPSSSIITLNYTTENGSTQAGSDYLTASGTLTFLAGELTKTVTVPILADQDPEPTETFTILLSSPSPNAQLSATNYRATGTILDAVSINNNTNDNTSPPSIPNAPDKTEELIPSESNFPQPSDYPETITENTPLLYTLQLNLVGQGQGQVTSSPTGLDCHHNCLLTPPKICQTTCIASFMPGTTVTFTPLENKNSVFSGWGGHRDCLDSTIWMTGSILCTAYFQPIRQLILTVQGEGQVLVALNQHQDSCEEKNSPCVHYFSPDSHLSLQAQPGQGFEFGGWQGNCESKFNPINFILDEDWDCQAIFRKLPPMQPLATPESIENDDIESETDHSISAENANVPILVEHTDDMPVLPENMDIPMLNENADMSIPIENTDSLLENAALSPENTEIELPENTTILPVPNSSELIDLNVVSEPTSPSIDLELSKPVPTQFIQFNFGNSLNCPPTTEWLDEVCHAGFHTLYQDLTIGSHGNLSHAILVGKVDNQGWVSNLLITKDSQLQGGIVTGYITNQGQMANFEFRGAAIEGGILAGHILSRSEIVHKINNVTFAAGSHFQGNRYTILSGHIQGDPKQPAILEGVKFKSYPPAITQINHVILVEPFRIEGLVLLGNHVIITERP